TSAHHAPACQCLKGSCRSGKADPVAPCMFARQRRTKLEAARAQSEAPGTLTPDRSGVAQSAEHPAVNRGVESSSLSPRAEEWAKRGMILTRPHTMSDLTCLNTHQRKACRVSSRTLRQLSYAGSADTRTPGPGSAGDQRASAGDEGSAPKAYPLPGNPAPWGMTYR